MHAININFLAIVVVGIGVFSPYAALHRRALVSECASAGECVLLARGPENRRDDARETRAVVGWQIHISRALLESHPELTTRALELLQAQLEEIAAVVPADAVKELRKVPLFFSPEYEGFGPRAEYHPQAEWLKHNGRDPAMAQGIEFTNIAIFERESIRMPNFALHELAHAYHDRVLERGFGNPEIRAAFDQAKAAGKYDAVERWHGRDRDPTVERAYAMTNPQEYFAETTEAFFSRNDFFPFDREQLRRHDPDMFALLCRLWGVDEGP